MDIKDDAAFVATLTDEAQKTYYTNVLKTTSEAAVTKFKTEDAAARAKTIPEKYELKLSENSLLHASDIDKVAAYAKANHLSQEQASALLKEQEATATALTGRQQEFLQSEAARWKKEVETDKDLGGTNYQATLKNITRVMDRFAPEGSKLRTLLNDSGYGNHPEWVRFVNAIGKAMAEDKTAFGAGNAGGGGQTTPAKRLYPNLP